MNNTIQLTTPELEKVKEAAQEMSASMTRVDSEKDLQKDIVTNMKEKYGLKPAEFNKICKIYHEQKLNDLVEAHENFVDFYDTVFNSK